MEEYPEELRTPPVSLVSLVGVPVLHPTISTFLHSQQPPINTLALPDFSKISLIARKSNKSPEEPGGFLKRGWLLKHRTRVPSVVAALFSLEQVNGGPAQWLQVCTDLENLKSVISGRNIKLIVVLVQSTRQDEISEDRMIALGKRAEIDTKYLIMFVQNDESEPRQSLNRLGNIISELLSTFYREERHRLKTRVEKKSFTFFESNIRYCFKVAVFAEFQRDWVEALKFYEDAYHALREIVGKSTRLQPIQRLVEIKSVAEQLNFKVSTLLLHSGRILEAIKWFWQHISCYKQLVGSPEAIFLHWEWVSRQFLVFAELLETSSASIPPGASLPLGALEGPLTEWEYQPAYYYQLAAHYLSEKKICLDISLSASETSEHPEMERNLDSVIPSVYVGQFAWLVEQGDTVTMRPLSDAEYMIHALAEGRRFQDSYEIIALLKKSFESYNNLKSQRMASYCSNRMGREYFAAGDFGNAKQLFDGIANLYRQEGWVSLLWEALGFLRECSRKLGLVKDFVEYSLEMEALPSSFGCGKESADHEGKYDLSDASRPLQREIIHEEVSRLLKGESVSSLVITEDHPLYLEIDPVSPLRAVFLCSFAFHEQVVKPGMPILFTLALLTQLAQPFEIDQLEIQFNQSQCNFIILNGRSPPAEVTVEETGIRIEIVPVLKLLSNKWLRLTYEIKSGQSGKLECSSVIVKIGRYSTICCRAESPASMEGLLLWKFEDRIETLPTKDPSLSFSGQKVVQVEEPEPLVDLILSADTPALVGEIFPVSLTVTSKGHPVHSGELKINLVDTRGSLLSPREKESFSSDGHHVELLGISGLNDEDESQIGSDNIKKIQESFGLVSVPFLNFSESWSCSLNIRWHKPKSVMLYVSLSYSSDKESKVNVHKSLQIEGKTAIIISHRFMMPFRRDPLLRSKIKNGSESDPLISLASNETSILIVAAKNCSEVPVRLISICIEADDSIKNSCIVRDDSANSSHLALLVPGEEFKCVFSVTPLVHSLKLGIGTACVCWRRDLGLGQLDPDMVMAGVATRHELPIVNVEKPPLVVSLDCPSHAILGVPLSFYMRIQNQTQLLQEIRYSLADSQSFLLSGAHCGSCFVLPNSEYVLSYKLVPLASGPMQLPQIMVNAVRYSAGLQPSFVASTIFVLPSKPPLKIGQGGTGQEPLSLC